MDRIRHRKPENSELIDAMRNQTLPLLCLTLSISCRLQATLIYSNMGQNNDNFYPGVGNGVQAGGSIYQAYGIGFRTGSTSYRFTELQLPLLNLTPSLNLSINLRLDAGAGPGAILDTLSVNSPVFPTHPAPVTITSLPSPGSPTLNPNSIYWITLEPTTLTQSWYLWPQLKTFPELQMIAYAYNPNGTQPGPWNYSYYFQNGSAFAVFGTPVPEPSSGALLLALTLTFGLRPLKRRFKPAAEIQRF